MMQLSSSDLMNDPFSRYKRPKTQSKQEGSGNGKVTIFLNLNEIAKSLNRTEKTIGSYISKNFGTTFRFDKKSKRYMINGHFTSDQIDKIVQKFIDTKIICKQCGNPETDLDLGACKACGFAI